MRFRANQPVRNYTEQDNKSILSESSTETKKDAHDELICYRNTWLGAICLRTPETSTFDEIFHEIISNGLN